MAVQRLSVAMEALGDLQADPEHGKQQLDLFGDRLAELEIGMRKWEADVEALVQKAKGTYNAARNSEERARTMERFRDDGSEEGDSDGTDELEAYRRAVQDFDAEAGAAEGVSPVHDPVEAGTPKEQALRAKYGA